MSKFFHVLYSMIWYCLYLICFYVSIRNVTKGTDTLTKICFIGKVIWHNNSAVTSPFFLGVMMHFVLGVITCSIVYTGFVLTSNNFHIMITSFNFIDLRLSQITGQSSEFRSYSNRFQMNLIVTGVAFLTTIAALDSTILAM